MNNCPHCQSQNPASAIACHACGEPLQGLRSELVPDPVEPEGRSLATRVYLATLAVLAIAGFAYRYLSVRGLQQSAALFIGIPALIGTLLALAPVPKSRTGLILRAMTLGLLLSGPVLGEGFICILVAAPLFLGIGVLIGFFADRWARRKRDKLHALVPIPLLAVLSLEGTTPWLSFDRHETVEVKRTLSATPAQVAAALAAPPRFEIRPTGVLAIGFPVPLEGTGSSLELGKRRTVHFSGGEGRPPGDLELEVTEANPGCVRFRAVSDTSHLNHWLHWLGSDVRWESVGENSTRVTWTVHFERGLDPAWYFGVPERFVVRRCAEYLLRTCATP